MHTSLKMGGMLLMSLLLGGTFFSPPIVAGETAADSLLNRARQLREENRDSEALALYEKVLWSEPGHTEALLEAAYLHIRQGWLTFDASQEELHYRSALRLAERALRQRPEDYQTHLLVCIARAKGVEYLSPGEQAKTVREVAQKLQELIAVNRRDPDPLYILSWLHFKIGRLGAVKKIGASLLYGGLPKDMSQMEAIALMKRSIALKPDYLVYHYDLGHFYQKAGQTEEARTMFQKVAAMTPHLPEEILYKDFAECRLRGIAGDAARNGYKCR